MQLIPRLPPGRKSRKALAYNSEIRRLRAQGYTMQAIREALADAGVPVSKSTVQREATRPVLLNVDTLEPCPLAEYESKVKLDAKELERVLTACFGSSDAGAKP